MVIRKNISRYSSSIYSNSTIHHLYKRLDTRLMLAIHYRYMFIISGQNGWRSQFREDKFVES